MSIVVSSNVNVSSEPLLDDSGAASYTMFSPSPTQGQDDEDGVIDPITPTNSTNNLQALLPRHHQPGFFSSDTEVDDLHDLHDTQNSTPDHQASPKSQFYFPGPLPSEPLVEKVRVLSYAPPHPEARGKGEYFLKKKRERGKDCDTNEIDGQETPQLERAGGGAEQVHVIDKDPGRDYSRRFYVPDVPSARPKSPEKSPPPVVNGNGTTNRRGSLHLSTGSASTGVATALTSDNMNTPVIISKAPPHPYSKRVDSTASMSSEVEMAAPGSTSSSRATIEARFQVKVPGVLEGEEVRVSGSDTVLGAWDVTQSVPMTRSPE